MKNSTHRSHLALKIRALRALQREEGAYLQFSLARGTEPRELATVSAEACLHQIVEAVCKAWDELHPLADDVFVEVSEQTVISPTSHPPQLAIATQLAQSERSGLDLSAITLRIQEQNVLWEDDTEEVLILSDKIRATDEQYAALIEGFWQEHQKSRLQNEEEKASFAQYQALQIRFGYLDGATRIT